MDYLIEIMTRKEFQIPKKIERFNVKHYTLDDFERVQSLYDIFFPNLGLEKKLLWQDQKSPFKTKDSFSFLMEDGDKVIAQYLVIPKYFHIYGNETLCVQSMGTMTHPDYSGMGISTYLAKLTYEFARIKGYKFVYGFPNPNSVYMFERKLKWTNFGKVDLYTKDITSPIKKFKIEKYAIEKISDFNKDFDNLWIKEKDNIPISIVRTKEYLNWRFNEHPLFNYSNYVVYDKSGNLKAYFILKRHIDKTGVKLGHIVDFLIDSTEKNEELNIFKIIQQFSIEKFRQSCSKFTLWLPKKVYIDYALNSLSYNVIQLETYFGYKRFNSENDQNLFRDKYNWYLTMASNDAF